MTEIRFPKRAIFFGFLIEKKKRQDGDWVVKRCRMNSEDGRDLRNKTLIKTGFNKSNGFYQTF